MNHDPFSSRADELGLLGACLLGGVEVATDVVSSLRPGMLSGDDVSLAIDIIAEILQHGGTPDVSSITAAMRSLPEVRRVKLALLSEAMEACGSPGLAEMHLAVIRDCRKRRVLREAAARLQAAASDTEVNPDEALAQLETGLDEESMPAVTVTTGRDVTQRLIRRLEERHKTRGKLGGITTGFRRLDRMTDGVQPGDMWIVGARPSIGKTAWGCAITIAACIGAQIPTLFVTAEMSDLAIGQRIASAISDVPMSSIRDATLNEGEMKRLVQAFGRISKAPIHWLKVDSGSTVASVCSAMRRQARRHGIRLVVVDYLQKLQPSERHEKRTYEVADVSGRLKDTAASLGLSMVCLAQINRESEKDKGGTPKLAQLADSGQIERDADCVCLLHRDRAQAVGEASLIVAKQRDGECGTIAMRFNGPFCRFEDEGVGE